ncbi:hypothetical protein AQUCO_05300015v1 [Aquilegia coerulea]|uniref:F-box domain-containing protein n=1 Tax=Aquilegia coerulea TaxID=218851 RepID=A0A2G5CI03_AQUCA|nr:hypothetical protein AQUCO_05300015v1 [Aquilegia coerulea]
MEQCDNTDHQGRRWESMPIDILVKIFLLTNIKDLICGISGVCSSWRLACADSSFWKRIDFAVTPSYYIPMPEPPYVWVASSSDNKVMRLLNYSLVLSRRDITSLVFHINLYLKENHLSYVAERSPHLQQLVLPAWNRISTDCINKAISKWKNLQSLTMPCIRGHQSVMKAIGKNCRNFEQLKIMGGRFDVSFASSISQFLPNLKVLSLRCSVLYEKAVNHIVDNMKHLQVLNLSHCLFVRILPPLGDEEHVSKLDESILVKASCLPSFYTCWAPCCVLCQRMDIDKGDLKWYKCEKDLWRTDEVMSLNYLHEAGLSSLQKQN